MPLLCVLLIFHFLLIANKQVYVFIDKFGSNGCNNNYKCHIIRNPKLQKKKKRKTKKTKKKWVIIKSVISNIQYNWKVYYVCPSGCICLSLLDNPSVSKSSLHCNALPPLCSVVFCCVLLKHWSGLAWHGLAWPGLVC